MQRRLFLLPVLGIAILAGPAAAQSKKGPVKVFILAGQSNMQGHAHLRTIDWLGEDKEFGRLLKKIKQPDGSYVERKDVWISYPARNKHGNLTVGYGANDEKIGPELMFGCQMGDHFENQVLLIKTAWGGRSLALNFRPPSAGKPEFELSQKVQDNIKAGKFKIGMEFELTLTQVRDVLANLKKQFPDYAGQGYEIAGFVWFQGWNDMINTTFTAEYASNMAHFIRDMRKELKSPKMPFVIGELGVSGASPSEKMKKFRAAQAAAASLPEFKGNVAFTPTALYWDTKAAELIKGYKRGKGWVNEKTKLEFQKRGSNGGYHYLGSAKNYSLIGYGLAQSITGLLEKK